MIQGLHIEPGHITRSLIVSSVKWGNCKVVRTISDSKCYCEDGIKYQMWKYGALETGSPYRRQLGLLWTDDRFHQTPALWGTWHIVSWNFTCKIYSNWLQYRHFLLNWKSAKRHRTKSCSHCSKIIQTGLCLPEMLVLGSTSSKVVCMYQLGISTRQNFNSISKGKEMEGICQYPVEAEIYKWT